MRIPKIIHQTWKTKDLHPNIHKIRYNIQLLNPGYEMALYDNHDISIFIRDNFSEYIYNQYLKLNVGAAKADFWRYCILYIKGGIYLDIDANILQPLDNLINSDDECIITREANAGIFNNWIMICSPNHPILLKAIYNCCFNIDNKITDNIVYLTGPAGALTSSINEIMAPIYLKNVHLYYETDDNLNAVLNKLTNKIRCRFYKVDMGEYAKWKHDFCEDLYRGYTHWSNETKVFI